MVASSSSPSSSSSHEHKDAGPEVEEKAALPPDAPDAKEVKEVKEAKPPTETKAEAIARKSASLTKSVAVLISQSKKAQIAQADLEREEKARVAEANRRLVAAGATGNQVPRAIALNVSHPNVMYGYDAEGSGLKKWVGTVVPEVTRGLEEKLAALEAPIAQGKQAARQEKEANLQGITLQERQGRDASIDAKRDEVIAAQRDINDSNRSFAQKEGELNLARSAKETAENQSRAAQHALTVAQEELKNGAVDQQATQLAQTESEQKVAEYDAAVKNFDAIQADLVALGQHAQLLEQRSAQVILDVEAAVREIEQEAENKISEVKTNLERKLQEKEREIDSRYSATITQIGSINEKLAKEVKGFEQGIKDIQNGWMNGQPVDIQAMQKKVDDFKLFLNDSDVKDAVPQPQRDAIKARLDAFPGVIESELTRIQEKAQAHVYTNRCNELLTSTLSQEIFQQKLTRGEEGRCDVVRSATPPVEGDIANFPMTKNSKRAYVIVGDALDSDAQSLYYINKATQECTLVCAAGSDEMKALLDEMEAGKGLSNWKKSPFTVRPLHAPTNDDRAAGDQLTPMQENRIKEIAHHIRRAEDTAGEGLGDWKKTVNIQFYNPFMNAHRGADLKTDWKEILPIAIRNPGDFETETQMRLDEEKIDARTARDNAIDRLKKAQKEEGLTEYDYKGEQFKIERRKDEKGDTSFNVVHRSTRLSKQQVPEAMAKMVALCYFDDPLSAVHLDCGDASRNSFYAKRMANELQHAIIAAENSAKKGVFIGITLSDNAVTALGMAGGKYMDLERRAHKLHEDWEKHTKGLEKKEESAAQKAVEVSNLGKVLASPVTALVGDVKQGDLDTAFRGRSTEERIEMLSAEVKKLDAKIQQFDVQNTHIQNELREVAKEIEKPEVAADTAAMTVQYEKLARLQAAQEVANQGLESLAGMARNYVTRMEGSVMVTAAGLDPDVVAGARGAVAPGGGDDVTPAALYQKCIFDAVNVGTKANEKHTPNSPANSGNNLSKIAELREAITSANRDVAPEAVARGPGMGGGR